MDSCSYNYSNFYDQPTAGASTSGTGVSTTAATGHTNNFNTDGEIDLSLFEHGELGDLYFGEQQGQGLEQEKEESVVPAGFEQGCVVSSQQEIDTGVCQEEVTEAERVQMDAPGTSKISTGVNPSLSGASSDGEQVRKTKPSGVSWRMEEEPYHQEGGVALWVKWRGRWRACIQCYPSDMSIATTRARPTYSKKTYVVVFFPNSRTYSWVDLEHACHISETPEPLAFGTHKSGRDAVENLDLPKQHMLRVLAANMLDLSDRLPVKAVVTSAQDVNAWKSFANEVVAAKEYSDVGKMLVKLYAMVSPTCYSLSWVQENFERWKCECELASNAQAVENLNKELVNAILWDEVSTLWDSPEQTAAGVEWKDWKRAVIENRTVYPSFSTTPDASLDSENLKRRMQAKSEVDRALKRSKLEVRRRYPTQLVSAKNDLSGFSERNNQQHDGQQADVRVEPLQELKAAPVVSTPAPVPKQDDEDVSGRSSSLARPSSVPKRLLSNYQLCAAFMEDKQRQCTRFPSQGSDYCCKHMAKYEKTGAGPASAPPKSSTGLPRMSGDRICAAITRFGKRCTHKVKANSMYCRKHPSLDMDNTEVPASLQNQVKENVDLSSQVKPEAQVESQEVKTPSLNEGVKAEDGCGPQEQTPECTDEKPKIYNWSTSGKQIDRLIRSSSAGLRIRCLGTCVTGEQCLHKSKPGSEYCEKHQPDTDSAEEEEPVPEVKKKHDPMHALLKAKSWLNRYLESAKVDGAGSSDSAEKLLEWVIAEASKDVPAATSLMQMVSERMEKLERFLKLQETARASNGEGAAQEDTAGFEDRSDNLDEEKQLDNIKCSICDEMFNEMVELGCHWKASHLTEAHWFLKAYACKDCKKEFTNKSSLERHCKADHPTLIDIPAVTLTVCSNCDEHFADFETLWEHVITGHPDHLSATPAISLPADEDFQLAEEPATGIRGSEDQAGRADKRASDSADSDDFMDILNPEESFEEMKPDQDMRENFSEDHGDSEYKFLCKVCGKRFLLLPDLGRHHQAAHMSAHVGTISKARTGGLIPGTSKSRKRVRVSKQGMSSMRRIKKALHSVQQQKNERSDHELDTNPKLPGPPPEDEVLSAASLVCCETGLHVSLEDKYEIVPVGLVEMVTKLANQQNVVIEWASEDYVCSKGCDKLSDARLHIYRKSSLPPSARKKSVVLCEDISFGKEFIPVPCVEDDEPEPCTCSECREGKSLHVDSVKPWETFKYVTKRLLDPSLGLDTKDSQIGCGCGRGRCSAKSCLHVEMFDSDYVEACDIWGEEMMGRFPYDADGRIILQEGYLVYECNASCMCSNDCPNRVLQRGVRVKLEVFKTRHKGWAVRAAQHIPRGTFVCEYLGEVLNDQEANKRGERYDKVGCSYLYDIDVHLNTGGGGRSRRGPSRAPRVKPFVIDATKIGNVARFINHSCSPNLINYQVLVESMDYQLAHIGLFASRDILCGEELAYDYRYKLLPGRGCPCHCGSSGCRGRLY